MTVLYWLHDGGMYALIGVDVRRFSIEYSVCVRARACLFLGLSACLFVCVCVCVCVCV